MRTKLAGRPAEFDVVFDGSDVATKVHALERYVCKGDSSDDIPWSRWFSVQVVVVVSALDVSISTPLDSYL